MTSGVALGSMGKMVVENGSHTYGGAVLVEGDIAAVLERVGGQGCLGNISAGMSHFAISMWTESHL